MKFLTLGLLIFVSLGCTESRGQTKCSNRQEKIDIHNWTKCAPRNTMVNSSIPKGCDEVHPAFIYAPQCRGLCHNGNTCSPTNSTPMQYKLKCKKGKHVGKCFTAEIELHHECKCACLLTNEDCQMEKKVFKPNKCQCECPKEKQKCKDMITPGSGIMFDDKTCTCQCPDNNCFSALASSPSIRSGEITENEPVENFDKDNRIQGDCDQAV